MEREVREYLLDGKCEIKMQKYSRILSVYEKNNKPFLVALVNPQEKMTKRKFRLVKSNILHEVHVTDSYIGSVVVDAGFFNRQAVHVFEVQ